MTNWELGTVVGSDGTDGVGIQSITKTGTSGLVDTYTITYTDGTTSTFTVTNGESGTASIVTSWESTLSDEKVPSEKLTKNSLDNKVDSVSGKGLSTNDFTTALKDKLDGIESQANKTTIVSSFSSTTSDSKVASEKLVKDTLDTKANSSSLSTVATSGSYSDLSNKPSIPSSSSDLSDGSDIVKKSSTSGLIKNDGTIDTTSYVSDVSGKEDTSNKVTLWSNTPTDTHYPSEKLTKDSLDGKQATLVSGTNIKTINNESLLGSGNITVSGGVSTGTFTELQSLITSASSGDVITFDKDYKYDSTTDSSLTNGIVIDKNITINANGHIIDGNASARAFTMTGASNTPITLNLTNIIIQNCKTTDNGGAIYANTYANLTINNSLFTRNESRIGGAIYINTHGILTITNSTFTYNKTTGSNCYGGVIFANNYCTVLIEESIFTNNSTTTRGGAIYGASSTNTTINNSILTNNSASEGGALSFRNLGSSTKLNMSGTSVYGNTASNSSNIYCNASMTVYNCILSDNASTYTNVTNYDDVSSENIVDNLTTDDATKVLSAKQGKALNDLIGASISYINQ